MGRFFPSWLRRENKPEKIKEIPQGPEEIKDARSFKELFEILKRKGGLTGSDGTFYSAEELIERIQKTTIRRSRRFSNSYKIRGS